MSYFKNKAGISGYSKMDEIGLSALNVASSGGLTPEFYEMEPAVVLDVILDDKHPVLNSKKVDISSLPENYKDADPNPKDIDYSWIGRALVRQCFSQQAMAKENLSWAIPLDVTGVVEYPLINETVIIIKYFGNLYYTKRLNIKGLINNSGDYRLEQLYGINDGSKTTTDVISLLTNKKHLTSDFYGSLGNYFLTNNKIRRLKKFEGDTAIESRFGQSIRFSTYDNNRNNDTGEAVDYKGGGNPMILIRNRQRKLAKDSPDTSNKKLPPIPKITEQEKNVGGLIEEDINHDGSSIHITSGQTVTKWVPTVSKAMFESGKEEQPLFSPPGCSKFEYPKSLNGDQIVINSDRLILSSRAAETFHYSKKRYGIVTDSECTIDAHDQIVLTTNNKTVINSPAIYLGQYDETAEPAALGQSTVDWLYKLCEWLSTHVHWYIHTHPDIGDGGLTGQSNPLETNISRQITELKLLREDLNGILSRRVFITGGGGARGADGGIPKDVKNTSLNNKFVSTPPV